jgi:ABC-type transport system involved in multi-copper enzyme maturation permease subunit
VRILIVLLIIASFLPVAAIVADYIRRRNSPVYWSGYDLWRLFVEEMNVWARVVGAGVSGLMLIAVAVRAAGSISGERDKQTLDDLLTTPLDSDSILFAKWLGSLLSVRWTWLWLGLVWMAAGFVTALNPVAVPLMVGAWFVYAAFLACLGLWFSMVCRTTLRAIVCTLISGMTFFLGHWLIWILFIPFLMHGAPKGMEWLAKFQVGLTPPLAMGVCFPILLFERANHEFAGREWVELLIFGIIGIGVWTLAAVILWGIVSARFRAMTNRSRYGRRPMVGPPHRPRLRSEVLSRNGVATPPARKAGAIEIVEALPVLDEDPILDVLRVEEPPRENSG